MASVGSLFINLGIRGAEKTIGALGAVKDGVSAIVPKSLEAKAGILGAMYALEQFLSHGADRATTLENMSATLGVTVDKLNLLGNAALESRTPLETVVSTLQSAQLALARLNTTGETQPWMARFIQLSGAFRLGPNPFMYLQQHIEELPKFIQAYADVEKDVGTRNLVLQSLGMSGLTAAVARGNFRPENMARAAKLPHLSEGETSQLDAVRTQLARINQEIEVGLSRVAAKFGPKMMGDIESVVKQMMQLVSALAAAGEKIHVLEGVGKVFEGWTDIFKGLNAVIDAFNDPKKMDAMKKGFAEVFEFIGAEIKSALPGGGVMESLMTLLGNSSPMAPGSAAAGAASAAATSAGPNLIVVSPRSSGLAETAAAPRVVASGATGTAGGSSNQNVSVNQSFHFDGTGDKKGVADAAATGIKNAYRQNPALLRHN